MPKYAARVDANHDDMKRDLERLGFSVLDCRAVGALIPGFPDLLVGAGSLPQWAPADNARGLLNGGLALLAEVKTPSGKLSVSQQEFAWRWKGPICVAERAEDVVDAVAELRRTRGR